MADYKLKLEIDAAVLQKQLETAFKKGFKFAGGGSGGAGGSSGAFNDPLSRNNKRMKKIYDKTHKLSLEQRKELEKHSYTLKTEYAKQKTLLRAQNIMLEKSGVQQQRTFRMIGQLLGGGIGGAGGAGMDRIITGFSNQRKGRAQVKATQQAYDDMAVLPGAKMGPRPEQEPNAYNAMADIGARLKDSPIGEFLGSTKKTFDEKVPGAKKTGDIAGKIGSKVPQAVKIAGIGAALAGGAGLAKMIVDSSPMLKQMLKILNIGIMLILRPIGDFIGFMLRPLLLEFVKKVAVPAYKKGAVLAKEWGSKMGKVITDLFTNPGAFLHEAIVNPLLARLEIMSHDIWRNVQLIGTYLNPLLNDKQKEAEWDRIMIQKYVGCSATSDQAINAKYKMYDFGAVSDTEIGKMVTEFQNLSEEELYKTSPGKLDSLPPMVGSLEYISELMLEENNETVKTNQLLEEMPEKIAAAQVGAAAEQAANALKEQETEFDKQRAAADAAAAEQAAEDKRIYEEQFGKPFAPAEPDYHLIPKGGLSIEAQKIIDKFEAWKNGEAWAGATPQAGGREGTKVNPLGTCQMGGMHGTGEFEMIGGVKTERRAWCADIGSMAGTGEFYQKGAIPTEIMEYENFAADSRAQMEAYSKAIEESVETGNSIKEEYDKIMASSALAAANANIAETNQRIMKESSWVMKNDVEIMSDATKSMADNLQSTAQYVAGILKKGYNIRKSSGERRYPHMGPQANAIGNAFGGSGTSVSNDGSLVKIQFGDGSTHQQVMDPQSYAHIMKMYAAGKAYRGKVMLSVQKMAAGGLITEPIFGIGQNSGKGYLMGEAGPERVTPGTGPANGTSGGNTFNITINASGIGDIERQLKPAILKMLKESTSRAGIV